MKLISGINEITSVAWSSFVYGHPYRNIFQTPEMFYVYDSTINFQPVVLGVENDNKEIIGILLAVIQKQNKGIVGKFSARSIIFGGPLMKDDNLDVLAFILSEYNKKIQGKAIYSQIRNLRNWSDAEMEVCKINGFHYESHLDIIHDLTIPIEKQFMAIHNGRRKNLKRAERQGLLFREIDNKLEFMECFEMIKSTYKRVKIPMPDKSFFWRAHEKLSSNILKVFVVVYYNDIIATRMVLCYKGLIYDWYAGASDNHLDKYPNDFLPWKIMEWGSMNNYRTFDFGGAGKPEVPYGVRDHKLKFGGKLVDFGRFENVHKPMLLNIGKIGLYLFKCLK